MFDHKTDAKILLWVLNRYTDEDVQPEIDSGVIPLIVSSLSHSQHQIKLACLKILYNVMHGCISNASKRLVKYGILSHYQPLLCHPVGAVRKEALRVLSTICLEESNIRAVIKHKLLNQVVEMFRYNENHSMHAEIVSVICEFATSASPRLGELRPLIKLNAIPLLCKQLITGSHSMIMTILTEFYMMLNGVFSSAVHIAGIIRHCGGMATILDLTNCEDAAISEKANDIITEYFPYARDITDSD